MSTPPDQPLPPEPGPEIVPPGTPVIDPPGPHAPPGPVEPPVIPPGRPYIDPPHDPDTGPKPVVPDPNKPFITRGQ